MNQVPRGFQGLGILAIHSGEDVNYACDAVVSKVGYSTLAEVYHAGVPLGYIVRQQFRETPALASYITAHMRGLAITESAFYSGAWLSCLPDLLRLPRQPQRESRGAEQVARFVYGLVRGEHGPLQR